MASCLHMSQIRDANSSDLRSTTIQARLEMIFPKLLLNPWPRLEDSKKKLVEFRARVATLWDELLFKRATCTRKAIRIPRKRLFNPETREHLPWKHTSSPSLLPLIPSFTTYSLTPDSRRQRATRVDPDTHEESPHLIVTRACSTFKCVLISLAQGWINPQNSWSLAFLAWSLSPVWFMLIPGHAPPRYVEQPFLFCGLMRTSKTLDMIGSTVWGQINELFRGQICRGLVASIYLSIAFTLKEKFPSGQFLDEILSLSLDIGHWPPGLVVNRRETHSSTRVSQEKRGNLRLVLAMVPFENHAMMTHNFLGAPFCESLHWKCR